MGSNANELTKWFTVSMAWLLTIFIPVWLACWLFGIALPAIVMQQSSQSVLGSSAPAIAEVLQAVTPLIALLVFVPLNASFMVLLERRSLALFTVRMGPNRVGPDGFLQTLADAVKLLLKEDITPEGADAVMFTMAPIVFLAPSIFGALPLLAAVTNNHQLFAILNLPTGVFFILAASSIPVVGIMMGSWASNNKYSLVGGLRSAAQAISYEIPLVLSLVTICLLSGTLDVVKIGQQQAGGILNWNLFGGGALGGVNAWMQQTVAGNPDAAQTALQNAYPYGIVSALAVPVLVFCTFALAILYLTGACAEINRIPFDLPEAESELVSGYNTEYSGIKFAIFFLAEFTNLFIVSSIFAVLFLGGGDCLIPPWLLDKIPGWTALGGLTAHVLDPLISGLQLIEPATFWAAIWIITKVYLLVLFAILVRGTLPRFRIDQLMDFGWKRLIPASLIVFLIVAFVRELVRCHA